MRQKWTPTDRLCKPFKLVLKHAGRVTSWIPRDAPSQHGSLCQVRSKTCLSKLGTAKISLHGILRRLRRYVSTWAESWRPLRTSRATATITRRLFNTSSSPASHSRRHDINCSKSLVVWNSSISRIPISEGRALSYHQFCAFPSRGPKPRNDRWAGSFSE